MTSKNDGTLVVFMIIALIAFCVGAGIGVSMVISDDGADVANNTTHIENVTHEMTTNLTDTNDDLLTIQRRMNQITLKKVNQTWIIRMIINLFFVRK